jgi:hypothetical protein
MNCCLLPAAIEAFDGVTAIETSDGAVTVSAVEPVTPLKTALMVVLPVATPFARPPAATVATLVCLELHVTREVRFAVLLLKCPVAVNCSVFPLAIEGDVGLNVIEVSPESLPVPLRATNVGLPKAP